MTTRPSSSISTSAAPPPTWPRRSCRTSAPTPAPNWSGSRCCWAACSRPPATIRRPRSRQGPVHERRPGALRQALRRALRHNPHFPINTLMLMRGATGMQMHEPERFRAYVDAVYHAMWVEPRNMNDPATVGAVLQAAGFDAGKLLALANAQDVKDRLKADTQEAVRARRVRRADHVRRRPDVLGPGPARFRARGARRLNSLFCKDPP